MHPIRPEPNRWIPWDSPTITSSLLSILAELGVLAISGLINIIGNPFKLSDRIWKSAPHGGGDILCRIGCQFLLPLQLPPPSFCVLWWAPGPIMSKPRNYAITIGLIILVMKVKLQEQTSQCSRMLLPPSRPWPSCTYCRFDHWFMHVNNEREKAVKLSSMSDQPR